MAETGTSWHKISSLAGHLEDMVSWSEFRGDLCLVISPEKIRKMIGVLKPQFEILMDLFGVDYLKYDPPQPQRFALLYQLYCVEQKKRIRLKVFLPETQPQIDSIHDLYLAANWFEREAFDMFGFLFRGHPNLQRILCHAEFEGHPLRKDYPSDKYQRLKAPAHSSRF